jgi:hypothetical protein
MLGLGHLPTVTTGSFLASHLIEVAVEPTASQSLRLLRAAQPKLVTPVLQVVHRVITRHLLGQAGCKVDETDSGAVMLIQRFASAAHLNIQLHCRCCCWPRSPSWSRRCCRWYSVSSRGICWTLPGSMPTKATVAPSR